MTREIPDDIKPDMIRKIPKQDDETHFSVSVKTKDGIPTGITVTAKGTF